MQSPRSLTKFLPSDRNKILPVGSHYDFPDGSLHDKIWKLCFCQQCWGNLIIRDASVFRVHRLVCPLRLNSTPAMSCPYCLNSTPAMSLLVAVSLRGKLGCSRRPSPLGNTASSLWCPCRRVESGHSNCCSCRLDSEHRPIAPLLCFYSWQCPYVGS